jgi:hypothetical protein
MDRANDPDGVCLRFSPVRRKRNEIVFATEFFCRDDNAIEVETTDEMPEAIEIRLTQLNQ